MKIAPKRNRRFIVAFLGIILTNSLHAQKLLLGASSPVQFSFVAGSIAIEEFTPYGTAFQLKTFSGLTYPVDAKGNYHGLRPLSADYYQKNMGIICKMEWSFEKNFHVPLRFRLGSLDYVNHLEGK
jgi:hypothetical protein